MRSLFYGVLAFSLLLSEYSFGNDWLFPLPIYYDDRKLGEVNVFTDGSSFSGIPANELVGVLRGAISPKILRNIQKYGSTKVGNKELNAIGVWLEFDSSDLSLSLSLEAKATNQQNIDFDGEYSNPIYSESSFFAWHNVFNFSNDYEIDESDENTNSWLGEWIVTGNLGGPLGVNFEGAGFMDHVTTEPNSDIDFYRGNVRLFVDRPSYPLRVSVGDVSTITTGHMPSLDLGAVSLERLWASLQPDRNIQNGTAQSLYLRESATVYIYINDVYFTDLRLTPGRYEIEDLPLAQGSNDIRFEILYQSGQREVVNYSQFFNTRLLRDGISDFSLYIGVLSEVEENDYRYDTDNYLAQGFYEYGVSDEITVGLNSTYHPDGQIVGAVLNIGSPFGNIGSRYSGLAYSDSEDIGVIVSLDYENSIFGNLDYSSPNFRLSFEAFTDYRATPWNIDDELESGARVIGDYSFYVTPSIKYTARGSWFQDKEFDDPDYFGALEIAWSPWDFTFTSGVQYSYEGAVQFGEVDYYFIARWDWFSGEDNYLANFEYQSRPNTLRGTVSKLADFTPNAIGYELTAEGDLDDGSQEYSARLDYIANRFTSEVEYRTLIPEEEDEKLQTVSARLSTAVSVVGSNVAWGRSYIGPAAIVQVHDSLKVPVHINGISDDRPESTASASLPGLVPLYGPHGLSTININVPDAPLGYDYGSDSHGIVAGTYTGHTVQVGSDASKTVLGTLLDEQGRPIVLRNGSLSVDGDSKSFFTNRGGRFAIDGIKSGFYKLVINGNPSFEGVLIIEESDENLIYLEPIKLKRRR
ncbi:hypothetical protein BCT86_08785 [Vibrio breoganii]|uniref:hypothetical protein n=1 Tax=Vibrio breoganii TaxID=553239 RepID=UPI000C847EAC|nr:hypothetical protein [Vibrio breoganii]PMG81718.1 hypothetical protein BCU83_01080 [Vibrio breoganii]PMG91222.1 hypothetical protein BCU80_01380 [Vibrio breoganii]PML08484.1 hypothetical protein BCT86_08785 [Vibrio breoganii]